MHFGDREIMTDLLMGTKYVSGNYHRAVLESANDRIRNTMIQLNNDELNLQKQIFDLMHDRNWYEVRPATASATASTWQVRQSMGNASMHQQMPYGDMRY